MITVYTYIGLAIPWIVMWVCTLVNVDRPQEETLENWDNGKVTYAQPSQH